MRSKKLFLFIISTFLLFTKSSYSENLAYVDIEFIMNNSLAGKSITDKLEIACSNQSIKILEIQRQGKKPQKIAEFLLGSKIKKGSVISNV